LQIKTIPVDGPRHFDCLQEAGQREIEIEEGLIIIPGFTPAPERKFNTNEAFKMKIKSTIILLLICSFHSYAQTKTGCILGDCKDGIGAMNYPDGSKYTGAFKLGYRYGKGTMVCADGKKYVGDWVYDAQNGQGIETLKTGEKYTGEFNNTFKHGKGTQTWPDGRKYVGEWRLGRISGNGTMTWANGKKYVGDWIFDKQSGKGTLTLPDGKQYAGDWEDDMRSGQGIQTRPDGEKYTGEWKKDKRNGQGTENYANGNQYEGIWMDDQRDRVGTQTWPDGKIYAGEWKDDKISGLGTMTYPSGRKDIGDWKDGIFIKARTYSQVTAIPKPAAPAVLRITGVGFDDSDGNKNGILDGNEKGAIKFSLSNEGKGDAYNLVIHLLDLNATKGLEYENIQTIAKLASGKEITVQLPVTGSAQLTNGETNFRIQITEGNGFDADPFEATFKTQESVKIRPATQAITITRAPGGCVLGDCKDGTGTMNFSDGSKYVGEWKYGKQNGNGTMTFADGNKYIGEWKNGRQNGKGSYTSSLGKYSGDWKDDMKNGRGVMAWPTGQKYLGNWEDDRRNGNGTMFWPNGEKYVGEWKDDKQNGYGTEYYANKNVYVGDWKEDLFNGLGTMTFANGQKSMGEWKDGVFVAGKEVSAPAKIPKSGGPVDLRVTEITFNDSKGNSNDILNPNENGEIKFTLTNKGRGHAYAMVVRVREINNLKGIEFSEKATWASLPEGRSTIITIPVHATGKVETGAATFRIRISEGNGFDADPFDVVVKTNKDLAAK
jgi:hypothetical protein